MTLLALLLYFWRLRTLDCKCILVVILIFIVNATLNMTLYTELIVLLNILICLLFQIFLKILLNMMRFLFNLNFLFILILYHDNFIFLIILYLFRAEKSFFYLLSIKVFDNILELFSKLTIYFSATQSFEHNSTIRGLCNKNARPIEPTIADYLIEKQTGI